MNPINPAASGDSTSPRNVYQVVTEQIIRQLAALRSEEHTSELQSRLHLVCRLLLEKKNDYANANQDAGSISFKASIQDRNYALQSDWILLCDLKCQTASVTFTLLNEYCVVILQALR